jgi:hypothetical protein
MRARRFEEQRVLPSSEEGARALFVSCKCHSQIIVDVPAQNLIGGVLGSGHCNV